MTVVIPVAVAVTLLSAFFSASSTAIFSVGGSRLRTLLEEGFKGAQELSEIRSRTGFLQGILLLLGTLSNLSVVGMVTGWASLRWGLQGFGIALPASALGIILFAELLLLVVVCMVLARTWAMLVNRLADRRFDAKNPRTARRVFARGTLGAGDGYVLLALTGVGFVITCYGFVVVGGWLGQDNWWPLVLSVPVLGFIALYSFTKRFTWLCHVFLGAALAVSPLAAAIAVSAQRSLAALKTVV